MTLFSLKYLTVLISIYSSVRLWPGQKEYPRLVLIRRAQLYHSMRVHLHSLYRRRSTLDDELLVELVELSLSPYARVRM
jgi:proteasome activator subunit 4